MTREQIDKLMHESGFPEPSLIETHISWVVFCNGYVYKIKKPIRYSFLDFSTPEKRKYYCEREVELNKRITDGIYLDVQAVMETAGRYFIGTEGGNIIDYAVRMVKQHPNSQMDRMLLNDEVTPSHIKRLAKKISDFHQQATIIHSKDVLAIRSEFDDLQTQQQYLTGQLGAYAGDIIGKAIQLSHTLIEDHQDLLAARLKAGYVRDCHGDLHSKNIFLVPDPQPFDCIEFNDDYRRIDVLNETAFLCMDLDACGREDLSGLFIETYNKFLPAINTRDDQMLFVYYKMYRANVRAKVNSLRAAGAGNEDFSKQSLAEAGKYIRLMERYIRDLETW
jgi:aminoglycoside phosphotransferase family enzyme